VALLVPPATACGTCSLLPACRLRGITKKLKLTELKVRGPGPLAAPATAAAAAGAAAGGAAAGGAQQQRSKAELKAAAAMGSAVTATKKGGWVAGWQACCCLGDGSEGIYFGKAC
jgi:hypothetical protein